MRCVLAAAAPLRLAHASVKGRLVLLAACVALPLIALAGAGIWHAYASEHAQDEAELVGRARAVATMIDRQFDASLSALRVLAASRALAGGDLDAFDAEMRQAAAALGGVIINLTSAAGEVTRTTFWPPGELRRGVAASDFLLGALKQNRPALSNLFLGPQTGRLQVGTALPVPGLGGDRPAWMLSLYPPPDRLRRELAELNLPGDWGVSVLDRERRVVARSRDEAGAIGRQPAADLLAATQAAESGLLKGNHRASDGVATVAAFARAPVTGYWAIVAVPQTLFSDPLNRTLRWAGLGALLVAGLGLAGALGVARGIVRGFARLAAGAAGPSGLAEIDALARAIVTSEASRRESDERLEFATIAGNIGIWDWDLGEGRFVFSARAKAIFGFPPESEVTLDAFRQATHPQDRALTLSRHRTIFETLGETRQPIEYRILRPDGAVRWVLLHGRPVGAQATPSRLVGTVQDITARKQADQAVRDSEARLRLAMDAGRMAIWEYDAASGQLSGSPAMLRLLGFPAGARPSQAEIHDRSAPGEFERCFGAARAARLRGERYFEVEHGYLWPDGSSHWLMLRAEFLRETTARQSLVGVAWDITERRCHATRLRENEEALRELLATIDLSTVFVRGWDGCIRFWSRGCEQLYGWSAAEAVGRPAAALLHIGYPVPVEEIEAALRTHGEWEGDMLHCRRDGTVLTMSVHKVLRQAAAGEPPTILETARDVTALRQAEETLRALNQHLEERVHAEVAAREMAQMRAAQGERLQALGQLAGGIAHDFNNVLQVVGSGATLVELSRNNPDRLVQITGRIQEAVSRGASVTSRLLVFARRGDLRTEPVEAQALLEGMQEMLGHTLGGATSVQIAAAEGLPAFMADRRQLETALINLAANARDAMPKGGAITLNAALEVVMPGRPDIGVRLQPGRYVALTLRDRGAGMEPAVLARACEPFFSTKGPGAGTGLGLATARAFAEQSGGAMRIESAPGAGTAVTLFLPAASPGRRPPQDRRQVGGPARMAPVRMLVVDDDAVVRESLVAGLQHIGHQVVSAASGREALALFEADPAIECLLTDLSMPETNGIELMRALRRLRPGLPAIVLTGYAAHEALSAADGEADAPYRLVWKPADIGRIARHIAEAMRGADAVVAEPLARPA